MREAFCSAMLSMFERKKFIFFTGDLGYSALEPLQKAMSERFINAGVAEQNMVSVAAGAASIGEQCWAYSIAPFIYGRPFEQIRNDVCLNNFGVKLVGNGGGYSYGVMGATHHALEDYGVMCALPNMEVFVPAFASDLKPIIADIAASPLPSYLRLGRCEKPVGYQPPSYSPWRKLLSGDAGVLIAVGPGVGGLLAEALSSAETSRPEIWLVSELPVRHDSIPGACLAAIERTGTLFVHEEHVAQGGVGQMLARLLLQAGVRLARFEHFHAKGYLSGLYGSQMFHRVENELDAMAVLARTNPFPTRS